MTESAGQALEQQRTPQQILAAGLRSETFREQIAMALPPGVTVDRFVRATVTAVLQSPDLASADRESVILAAIRCAQDGLLPDGREAAIAVFAGKAAYMPMIGGLRKALADYGWTLRTRAVYAADEFSFTEEPPEIRHVPAVSGERGELVFAYAIASHRDGRRIQRVVFKDEVLKRREIAKSKAIWDKWPAEMWEKTAGHIIFDEIPLGELDEERDRVARIVAAWERDPRQATAAIYGRTIEARELTPGGSPADVADGGTAAATDQESRPSPGGETRGGDAEQAADGSAPPAVGGSSSDPEPALEGNEGNEGNEEPTLFAVPDKAVEEAALTVMSGNGKTIAEILIMETGPKWVEWALRNLEEGPERTALELVVQHRAPELWAAHAGEAA